MSDEENEVLFNRILQNMHSFSKVEYAPKVLISALTEMLLLFQVPFINRKFVQILDLTVSLLELTSSKKSALFSQEEDEEDEAEYANSLILLKNDMKSLD
jgi:hypothetical protein